MNSIARSNESLERKVNASSFAAGLLLGGLIGFGAGLLVNKSDIYNPPRDYFSESYK